MGKGAQGIGKGIRVFGKELWDSVEHEGLWFLDCELEAGVLEEGEGFF